MLIELLQRPGRTGRVPERLQQVHVRRGGQVEAHAARLEAEQQHRRAAGLPARKLAQHLARIDADAGGPLRQDAVSHCQAPAAQALHGSASGRRERLGLHGVSGSACLARLAPALGGRGAVDAQHGLAVGRQRRLHQVEHACARRARPRLPCHVSSRWCTRIVHSRSSTHSPVPHTLNLLM